MTKRAILLFSKPATPGRVKTRLVGPLSAEEAARLHEAFLLDLHDRFSGGPVDLRIFWAAEADEALPARPGGGRRQVGAGLGERLRRAIEASSDCEQVVVVGSDHPELSEANVERAFEELDEGADVVFGPALDGGYYLVGLRPRALRRELFEDIPWSTEEVLAASIARAETLGLAVALLEPGCDVDRPEDLAPLAARLRRAPDLAPRTLAALARLEPGAFGGRQE